MIVAVKLVFTAATLCYFIGFLMRIRNNDLHRKLMALGFVLTLFIAVVLLVGVYGFSATYAPAGWLIDVAGGEAGGRTVLLVHRGVASLTFVVLIVQIASGMLRLPLHKRLYTTVISLWLISYVSGLVVFV